MTFQPGNQLWKARLSPGRKPKFNSCDELWKACQEYFEWAESNPLLEERCFAYQGEVTKASVAKMRAMTVTGLCIHLGISFETWSQYRKKSAFSEVTTQVENIIRTQKIRRSCRWIVQSQHHCPGLGIERIHHK